MGLAGEAHAEASAAGADEIATRALIFMGMAESGRGGPRRAAPPRPGPPARAQRAAGAGQRNETLAMIHESHVLLALGRPDDAAARARAGADRAHELGLTDHELVLTGNLGEALAAAGELAEARAELERAADGWTALERGTHSPADPGLAWLLLAEGRIDEALDALPPAGARRRRGRRCSSRSPRSPTGHALAAPSPAARREAPGRAARARCGHGPRTDDRLTSIPLLAAVAEVADMAQAVGPPAR